MKKNIAALGLAAGISLSCTFAAAADWVQQGDKWAYQETETSYAFNKWVQVGEQWYHFDENGFMQTGWLPIKKKWYYLDLNDGHMKTGWVQDVDDKWYYMDESDGYMWRNRRTPDGYFVDESGIFDLSKGNTKKSISSGPGSKIINEKKVTLLKGVEFPPLSSFASQNLSTATWGVDGSMEALNALSVALENPIQINENSIIYAINGSEKLRLTKAGDHYELVDYGSISPEMETVLLAMCSIISSTPQDVYNAIYTAAEYDQRVMRSEYYMNFGDSKILYTVQKDHVVFSIAAK